LRYDVSAYGEMGLRLKTKRGESLAKAETFDVEIVGSEFNVVSNVTSLGHRVGLMSAVPSNALGQRILNACRQNNVGTELIEISEIHHRAGVYFAETMVEPRVSQVLFDRKDSAFSQHHPSSTVVDQLLDSRVIFLTGITAALSPITRETTFLLAREARSRNVKVCVDTNFRSRLWSVAEASETLRELVSLADICIAPTRDIEALFAGSTDPIENARLMSQLSPAETICVTDGARGAYLLRDGTVLHEPALEVEIVDRLGAGDAFAAGVLHSLLTQNKDSTLIFGTSMAAVALSSNGEQVSISARELDSICQKTNPDVLR